MAVQQVTYKTITTRLYSAEEHEMLNQRNTSHRFDDLKDLGNYAYLLISTVTYTTHDGTVMVDTLAQTETY
ncbi:hypothetical protein [Microbacterium testaceum]|uniref:hypothetical protein n=1 Tax=Microbacterium testaceum TaxID=2033 RepID=UPI002AC41617|nr:hypothetical protein [Microbacterium testaceum]MDZ5146119.1 hypothetical protein [Microbacterium testaceum]